MKQKQFKPFKSFKSVIEKMVNFISNNKLNFLFLFVLGFALYNWIIPEICLNRECLFTLRNFFYIIFTIIYLYFVIKVLEWIKSDEKVDEKIKILTKYKLMKELGLKINKKEIEKELKLSKQNNKKLPQKSTKHRKNR